MKKYSKILIIIISIMLVFVACSSKSSNEKHITDPDLLFDIAQDFIKQGKFIKASAALFEAQKLDPRNHEIRNMLGFVFMLQKNYIKSVEHFKEAISLKSDYSDAYVNLAQAYVEQEMWEEAIENSRKALDNLLYFTPYQAYNIIGWSYYKMKKYDKAIEAYSNALKSNPNYIASINNLGLVYLERKDYKKAIDEYYKLLSICKECPETMKSQIYFNIADAYSKWDRKQEANKYYKKCHSIDPDGFWSLKCELKIK
ncbi:MAG: tetratricopeptide repeat protein [Pseudomonadota bacterium]